MNPPSAFEFKLLLGQPATCPKTPPKTRRIPHRGMGTEVALDMISVQVPDSVLVISELHESANYTQGFENMGGGGGYLFSG
jgi:hypothetical protein